MTARHGPPDTFSAITTNLARILDHSARCRLRAEDGFEIQGLLSDEQAAQMRAHGYEIEPLEDADRVASERLRECRKNESADDEVRSSPAELRCRFILSLTRRREARPARP